MNTSRNPDLNKFARRLRREMTKEERHLWYDYLKDISIGVKRQKIFGQYIADFYCPSAQVVIELDGSQHYEEEALRADAVRDQYFNKIGLRVLRYSNAELNRNFIGVCEDIARHLKLEV